VRLRPTLNSTPHSKACVTAKEYGGRTGEFNSTKVIRLAVKLSTNVKHCHFRSDITAERSHLLWPFQKTKRPTENTPIEVQASNLVEEIYVIFNYIFNYNVYYTYTL
jgi:hypothetical protein